MTHTKNQGVSPIAAGVAGAVIGAGAAIVGAVVMQDEGNKKKVKKMVDSFTGKARTTVDEVTDVVNDKKLEAEGKVKQDQAKN